jgi:hypothetical protein
VRIHTELTSVKATLGIVKFVICATPSRLLMIKMAIEVPSMKRHRRILTKRETLGLFTTLVDSPHKQYIRRNARKRKTPSGRSESILKIGQKAEIHLCTKTAFAYPSSNLIVKSRGLQSLPTVKRASFGPSEIMLQDSESCKWRRGGRAKTGHISVPSTFFIISILIGTHDSPYRPWPSGEWTP